MLRRSCGQVLSVDCCEYTGGFHSAPEGLSQADDHLGRKAGRAADQLRQLLAALAEFLCCVRDVEAQGREAIMANRKARMGRGVHRHGSAGLLKRLEPVRQLVELRLQLVEAMFGEDRLSARSEPGFVLGRFEQLETQTVHAQQQLASGTVKLAAQGVHHGSNLQETIFDGIDACR